MKKNKLFMILIIFSLLTKGLKSQNDSILLGGSTPISNHSSFDKDGSLWFINGATVFEDYRISPTVKSYQYSGPTLTQFIGNIMAYAFSGASTVNEVYFEMELPHSWKEGTSIYPHIHWAPSATGTGYVKWYLEYSWVNTQNTYSSTNEINSGPLSVDGIALKSFVSELPGDGGGISGNGKTISSILMGRLFRDPETDTYSGDAFVLSIDFHYEVNSVGSRTIIQK